MFPRNFFFVAFSSHSKKKKKKNSGHWSTAAKIRNNKGEALGKNQTHISHASKKKKNPCLEYQLFYHLKDINLSYNPLSSDHNYLQKKCIILLIFQPKSQKLEGVHIIH